MQKPGLSVLKTAVCEYECGYYKKSVRGGSRLAKCGYCNLVCSGDMSLCASWRGDLNLVGEKKSRSKILSEPDFRVCLVKNTRLSKAQQW